MRYKECTVRHGVKGIKCKQIATKLFLIGKNLDYMCDKCFNSFNNCGGFFSNGIPIKIKDIKSTKKSKDKKNEDTNA